MGSINFSEVKGYGHPAPPPATGYTIGVLKNHPMKHPSKTVFSSEFLSQKHPLLPPAFIRGLSTNFPLHMQHQKTGWSSRPGAHNLWTALILLSFGCQQVSFFFFLCSCKNVNSYIHPNPPWTDPVIVVCVSVSQFQLNQTCAGPRT